MKLPPKTQPLRMTSKQVAVLKLLLKRNTDGSLLDILQIRDAVAPGTTRGATLCTMRHLAAHGLVEEQGREARRGQAMRLYAITELGMKLIRPLMRSPEKV